MTGLGITAVGAAFANYSKAKSEYDALVEKKEGLEAAVTQLASAIDTYNRHKYDNPNVIELSEIDADKIDIGANDFPEGLKFAPMVRVANLVGKMFYSKQTLVLINESSHPYWISKLQLDTEIPFVNEQGEKRSIPIQMLKPGLSNLSNGVTYSDTIEIGKYIQPGEALEIDYPVTVSAAGDMQGYVRDIVCEACGRRLITSCGKISINNAIKADFRLWWANEKPEYLSFDKIKQQYNMSTNIYKCWNVGVPGVLRYCMEAGLK